MISSKANNELSEEGLLDAGYEKASSSTAAMLSVASSMEDGLQAIPNEHLLKRGISAKRNDLLEAYEDLSENSTPDSIRSWLESAEIFAARSYAINAPDDNQTRSRSLAVSDLTFVRRDWMWPWEQPEKKARSKKKPASSVGRNTFVAMGALGAAGVAMVLAMAEDEETFIEDTEGDDPDLEIETESPFSTAIEIYGDGE